jgi:hypothetical protein
MEKDYNGFDLRAYIVLQSHSMRTSWEAGLFAAALAVTLILCLVACGSFAFLLSKPALAGSLSSLPSNPWWFILREPGPRDGAQPLGILAATAAATAVAFAFALRAQGLHTRNRTPVFPYLLLFFLTLGTECLRGVTAVLYATNGSIQAGVTFTRAVYWGRFVGLFALLLASLYCTEVKYRHLYVLGGGSFLVALTIAASIPIDRTIFLSQLTWKLADEEGVWFVNVVIAALVLLTAVGASVLRRDRRYLVVAAGFALLLTARQLLFFMVEPVALAGGIVALTAGAVVCTRSLGSIYKET